MALTKELLAPHLYMLDWWDAVASVLQTFRANDWEVSSFGC